MLMEKLIAIICLLVVVRNAEGDECKKLLANLADTQQHFVYCSTTSSVPVTLCLRCKENHDKMIAKYQHLKENCTQYFDKDRINIVSTTQSILVGLWDKAYCDDCFTNDSATTFGQFYGDLTQCFANEKDDVCHECLVSYQKLTEFYINLDQHNNGKVCYDLQDAMNRTRYQWSTKYNCCHRSFDATLFLIACGVVAMLPLIFYGGSYAYVKREERSRQRRSLSRSRDPQQPTTVGAVISRALQPYRQDNGNGQRQEQT